LAFLGNPTAALTEEKQPHAAFGSARLEMTTAIVPYSASPSSVVGTEQDSDTLVSKPHDWQAYARAQPAARAIPTEKLVPLNLDLTSAIVTATGALPRILPFRASAAALSAFDIANFDELDTYIRAAIHAHTQVRIASAPPSALEELTLQGTALRRTLLKDAEALLSRDLLEPDCLRNFDARTGYRKLAFDLMGLAGLFRDHWPEITGRTGVITEELDRAELIGDQLVTLVGLRARTPAAIAEAAEQRRRHFTLLVRAYDQVRRAIGYLRFDEGDLEASAPSLYTGKQRKRRAATAHAPAPAPNQTQVPIPESAQLSTPH
jgi:hypothetical protein